MQELDLASQILIDISVNDVDFAEAPTEEIPSRCFDSPIAK
jgi:hypothetical protein